MFDVVKGQYDTTQQLTVVNIKTQEKQKWNVQGPRLESRKKYLYIMFPINSLIW